MASPASTIAPDSQAHPENISRKYRVREREDELEDVRRDAVGIREDDIKNAIDGNA